VSLLPEDQPLCVIGRIECVNYACEGCRKRKDTFSKDGKFFSTAMPCFLNFNKLIEGFPSDSSLFSMCVIQSLEQKTDNGFILDSQVLDHP
jgi:hypothetical protein